MVVEEGPNRGCVLMKERHAFLHPRSNMSFETRSTPEVWDPKKSGLYKEQLSNKVWLFFPQKHLNLHLFGFQEKFESNRPGKFESNGPFEPIDVAQ